MKAILYLFAPVLTTMIGLYSFTSLATAILFVFGLAIVFVFAVRFHEKHHRSEQFDDKINEERVESSREWLLNTWKGGDKHNVED